jgi:hypothetical protein
MHDRPEVVKNLIGKTRSKQGTKKDTIYDKNINRFLGGSASMYDLNFAACGDHVITVGGS